VYLRERLQGRDFSSHIPWPVIKAGPSVRKCAESHRGEEFLFCKTVTGLSAGLGPEYSVATSRHVLVDEVRGFCSYVTKSLPERVGLADGVT